MDSYKNCESDACEYLALPGERFCTKHRKLLLEEMRKSGFVQQIKSDSQRHRRKEDKENIKETKYGVD